MFCARARTERCRVFDRHQDLKTIRRCKRGEEAAFAEILARYRGPIYNLCYRMSRSPEDARDLSQEVFIKVFRLLDRFDEEYAFSSWLFRIATNHCIDHLRRNQEAVQRLEEVIADLPPHYRAITLRRHQQQLSYDEIAEVLQLPLGTVKARIHRARAQIQQMLEERSYDI
ncbi:MAG: sigma-70 family RNA polymerase sigma factor [bacterium]|nr:sigma-70 family RNA polymerase sigma factor [bacterium]